MAWTDEDETTSEMDRAELLRLVESTASRQRITARSPTADALVDPEDVDLRAGARRMLVVTIGGLAIGGLAMLVAGILW